VVTEKKAKKKLSNDAECNTVIATADNISITLCFCSSASPFYSNAILISETFVDPNEAPAL